MVSKNVQDTSNFQTNVYRKKTNTNRYLHFDSNHHLSVKKEKIISKNILKENAYPEGFVEKTLLQIENPPNNNQNRQNPTSNMTIPYIPRISERLKRLGNEFNIRTTFKTNNTLRSILTHTKPKNKDQNEKNCICKIPCQSGKHYIGETSRPLDVRVKRTKITLEITK
ncbi:hypothetical protein NQ315_011201 [Exocentrus adspersus]|uniref:Uncharacterized protein n=1 Tax=Exocentrus adspersus TaxID=1586481 RepID=A0AAV8V5T7_9CUCU|nr:hypothetical protein NQ315_011201 [Exocentrus adspersus]